MRDKRRGIREGGRDKRGKGIREGGNKRERGRG
jgi:hypothetical protein